MTCRAIVELCKAIEGDAVVIGASLPVNVTFVPVAVNFSSINQSCHRGENRIVYVSLQLLNLCDIH